MARRKAKRSNRKSAKKINILSVAEAVVVANAVTQGLFNTNAISFVTGRIGTAEYSPSNLDNIITLPELLGLDYMGNKMGGTQSRPTLVRQQMSFTSVGAGEKIKENLKANGIMMGAQLILIPIGFKSITKLTSSPRRQANKLLSYTGIGVKV
jgi:hypothetical protein